MCPADSDLSLSAERGGVRAEGMRGLLRGVESKEEEVEVEDGGRFSNIAPDSSGLFPTDKEIPDYR